MGWVSKRKEGEMIGKNGHFIFPKNCKHGRIKKVVGMVTGNTYSWCPDCHQRWNDNGRRWNKSFFT